MIAYHYRVTKYDPRFRDTWGVYQRDEWTTPRNLGESIGGHVLTEDEYHDTINRYPYAVEAFAIESGVTTLTARRPRIGPGPVQSWGGLADGEQVSLDQAVDLVRIMLTEGDRWIRLEADLLFHVHVGYDLYLWIGSHRPCPNAVADVTRTGLFVEPGIVSPDVPDPDEPRHWWLSPGVPVHQELASYDRETGAPLDHVDLPESTVALLRPLFAVDPQDVEFQDTYEIGDDIRGAVEDIVGWPLDPARTYQLESHSRRPKKQRRP